MPKYLRSLKTHSKLIWNLPSTNQIYLYLENDISNSMELSKYGFEISLTQNPFSYN